jgi:hypothetical protein
MTFEITRRRLFRAGASQRASSADEVQQDHDNGHHQENMDEATQGVGSNEPEKPQYEQYDCNRIEHVMHLFAIRFIGRWLM